MKTNVMITVMVFFAAVGAFAQSAARLDAILASDKITYEHAAYLIMTAKGKVPNNTEFNVALVRLKEENMVKPSLLPESDGAEKRYIPLKTYSFLLMKAFGLKGGLLYGMFPSPRYAYRHLCYLSVIQGTSDPDMPVKGNLALQMIDRISEYEVRETSQGDK